MKISIISNKNNKSFKMESLLHWMIWIVWMDKNVFLSIQAICNIQISIVESLLSCRFRYLVKVELICIYLLINPLHL